MYYERNMETQKIELHSTKEEWNALTDEQKQRIKSAFLFSRSLPGWVSRAKFPNLWSAEDAAKAAGAENRGKSGETLSFEEQMERKAERAEARAERYEARAERAAQKGKSLQAPIDRMRGDIAFFTQPNINSAGGRAFTRRREKMFAAYERGMAEFKKSDYYSAAADTARETASCKTPTDKGFCLRRIAEAQKTIRAQKKNLDAYKEKLGRLNSGEEITLYGGDPLTPEMVQEWVERSEEIMEQATSMESFYQFHLDRLGGVQFSRENIKPGYVVKLETGSVYTVESTGPKNFKYKSFGLTLQASYAEVVEVLEQNEKKPDAHPFRIGDKFTVKRWTDGAAVSTACEIVKATEKTVTVRTETGQTYLRKPYKTVGELGTFWHIDIDRDYYKSCYCRKAEETA